MRIPGDADQWKVATEQRPHVPSEIYFAATFPREGFMEIPDYYGFLQISANAEPDTIHRVYRFLAARFHRDDPETGDDEKFFLLTQAYAVLSSPESNATSTRWIWNDQRQGSRGPPLVTVEGIAAC
jgi:hypothetical protein